MMTNALSPKAAGILRKVGKAILEEPKRLVMSYWIAQQAPGSLLLNSFADTPSIDWGLKQIIIPECGVVGCIAGWVCITQGRPTDGWAAQGMALTILEKAGVSAANIFKLFYVDRWPEKFRTIFATAETPEKRAEIVAGKEGRIEHFIKYGE